MAFSISLLKPLETCSRLGTHTLKAEATLFTQRGSHVRDKRIKRGCEASSIEFTDGGTLSRFHVSLANINHRANWWFGIFLLRTDRLI